MHAPSKEIHDKALEQVLSRIDKHGLSLNIRKCKFNVSNVNYLGYEIFDGCVKPDPERVKPIFNFPLPTSSKALQLSFRSSTILMTARTTTNEYINPNNTYPDKIRIKVWIYIDISSLKKYSYISFLKISRYFILFFENVRKITH